MLLFEFVGELFQFEAREPEFDVLSQLPPNRTANLSMLPSALLLHNPCTQQAPNLRDQHLCRFDLVWRDAAYLFARQKPQPKSQLRESRVCDVKAGNLSRLPCLHNQFDLL